MFIELDPTNRPDLLNIMDKYGDSKYPYYGQNINGEDTEMHISKNQIILVTYQHNKHVRKNVYTNDNGIIISEELYCGKWE